MTFYCFFLLLLFYKNGTGIFENITSDMKVDVDSFYADEEIFTAARISLSLFAIMALLVYKYLTRNHNYWSSRGVPGPRPLPFFGTYLHQFFVPFQESELRRYQKYGKIYGIYDGTEPGLIVGEPKLIKQIMCGSTALEVFTNRRAVKTTHPVMSKFLSSLEDNEWKRVRSITTPNFSSGKLKTIFPIMQNASDKMLDTLGSLADRKEEVDAKLLYGNYTMDVIAYSAFATRPDDVFVRQASLLFTFPFWRKFLDYVVPMWLLELVRFTVLPPDPMDFFRKVTISAIRRRRAENVEYADFLQLLMNAEDDSITGTDQDKKPRSKVLSEDEILSQSVLFFSVGFETSSQLLAYCSYCFALNQEAQEKAYQEIVEAVKKNGNRVDHDLLQTLDYLTAAIDESLRIYNPVLRMERRASADFVLEDTGITVPKGMVVGIPVWAMHHTDEYFKNPDEFNPDRFMPKNRPNIVQSTYLPFGEGPRNCIGMRFALLESKLALVEILLKFRFVVSPGTKIPLEFFPTGRPLLGPKAIMIGVERRIPTENE